MDQNSYMCRLIAVLICILCIGSILLAQTANRAPLSDRPAILSFAADGGPALPSSPMVAPSFVLPASLPRMSPALALSSYQDRSNRQAQALAGYRAATIIRAELPDNRQRGEFELERQYTAPHTLSFKSVRFQGDGFVKTNVIARLLQSEVEHVQKDDPALTALRPENYKFSYKGAVEDGNRTIHIFQVKPRKKRAGLFKGHVLLDAMTGALIRAEGRVAKSPSLFVKKIDFVQDYADINGFMLPVHMHSEAKVALVGRTIVDVTYRDYQPVSTQVASELEAGSH